MLDQPADHSRYFVSLLVKTQELRASQIAALLSLGEACAYLSIRCFRYVEKLAKRTVCRLREAFTHVGQNGVACLLQLASEIEIFDKWRTCQDCIYCVAKTPPPSSRRRNLQFLRTS